MDRKELLKKVRQLELMSKKHVQELLTGGYHSVFKGKGIEFHDVKEYSFDDDIKDIDWNVSARSEECYVKNYVEERELQLVVAVDISASQGFGSRSQVKRDLAVELAALLSFSAINNRDKVGLLLFSDRVEKYVPPKGGRNQVMRIVRDLVHQDGEALGTDVSVATNFLLKNIKKKGIIFMISDFMDESEFRRPMSILGRKHDVVAIQISDPLEDKLPGIGFVRLWDSETGEERLVNFRQKSFREHYSRLKRQEEHNLKMVFRKGNVDYLHFHTHLSYINQLTEFFRKRARRY